MTSDRRLNKLMVPLPTERNAHVTGYCSPAVQVHSNSMVWAVNDFQSLATWSLAGIHEKLCMCSMPTGRHAVGTFMGHKVALASAIASWRNPKQRQRKPAFAYKSQAYAKTLCCTDLVLPYSPALQLNTRICGKCQEAKDIKE